MNKLSLALIAVFAVPALAANTGQQQIQATLTAMNDGVGLGEGVIDYIESQHIQVEFARQAVPARFANNTILLSDTLPPLPRVLAPYIADETAKLMLAHHPQGPERAYMRDGIVARCWIELGGDRGTLPKLDASVEYTDAALAERIHSWDRRYLEYRNHPDEVKDFFRQFFELEAQWRFIHRQ